MAASRASNAEAPEDAASMGGAGGCTSPTTGGGLELLSDSRSSAAMPPAAVAAAAAVAARGGLRLPRESRSACSEKAAASPRCVFALTRRLLCAIPPACAGWLAALAATAGGVPAWLSL
eukprot:scaffold63462_cov52-Phaeocystis_antarctica.AAC.2